MLGNRKNILAFLFIILYIINKERLNGDKVYVIGIVTKKEPYRSGGVIYDYVFYYKGIKYTLQNTDAFWNKKLNNLFFIKLYLRDNVTIGDLEFIDNVLVPSCLTILSVPTGGWKVLPKDTCKIKSNE